MDSNCKNKFNLDHVYCHTNDSAYIRANTETTDILSLLKENKQLKSMLLLHLDLIQEQSNQLMAKDKLIATLREENEALKLRLEKSERRLQLKCTKNSEPIVIPQNLDVKKESPPIPSADAADPSVENNDGPTTTQVNNIATTSESKYKICDDNFTSDSIIGESNGKFISKIVLQRIQGSSEDVPVKEEQTETMLCDEEVHNNTDLSNKNESNKAEQSVQNDTEDSFSCGSGDQDQVMRVPRFQKPAKKYSVLTTKRLYPTREWEDIKHNEDTNKEEAEALRAENPNLEIPKWTIREFTGLYSIEGTEDLSDDTFLKRHLKLEHDEKRRKKWDVQRIREQRTIERLKRRHCKDEIQDSDNNQEMTSFYPSPDSIKFIQITEDLPVQAFGECIPRISPAEFTLPWQVPALSASTSLSSPSEHSECQPSSFVFLKKRRRHSQCASVRSRRSFRRSILKN